jgi:hypothetical protein
VAEDPQKVKSGRAAKSEAAMAGNPQEKKDGRTVRKKTTKKPGAGPGHHVLWCSRGSNLLCEAEELCHVGTFVGLRQMGFAKKDRN